MLLAGGHLGPELRAGLEEAGWRNGTVLACAFDPGDAQGAAELVRDLTTLPQGDPIRIEGWALDLLAWQRAASDQCRRVRQRTLAGMPEGRQSLSGMLEAANALPPGPLPSLLQLVCRPLVPRTRRQRSLADAGSPAERAAIEVCERDRWLDRLVSLLQEAGLPVVAIAAATADPVGALRHVAGGLRSRTLRARIRTWSKIRFWMLHVHGVVFPTDLSQMVDFLEERVHEEEGCGRTVPGSIAAARHFMEQAGGVPHEDQICRQTFWKRVIASCEAELRQRQGTTVRKAPPFCLMMILSLEYSCAAPALRIGERWPC